VSVVADDAAPHQRTEPMPEAVADAFGPASGSLSAYGRLLADVAVARGLLGPSEPARLWSRHLLNCAAIAPLIPHGVPVVDLGSGAGLPGLVLALVRPDLSLILVEPMERRVAFLRECVAELGLHATVRVRRDRAEHVAGGTTNLTARVVTARAVAPLHRLVPLAAPLLTSDGVLLALKGQQAADELADAAKELRRYNLRAQIRQADTVGGGSVTVVAAARAAGGSS
jgi:16S rRNA (guanine527-N7)-methyltransferase